MEKKTAIVKKADPFSSPIKGVGAMTPAQPNVLQNSWNKAKNWATGAFGGDLGKAKAHYDNATTPVAQGGLGQNPIQAGIGAFGQLGTTTRGVGGGALGLIGSAALSPRGSRGIMMPLATGLGAALSVANGPDGFKLENLMKPEALMAGGIGAGVGLLGHHLLGGEEEDDDDDRDPSGLSGRAPHSREGSSWLPTLGAVGALGLGAYGLHRYMNQPADTTPPAPKPSNNPPVVTTSGSPVQPATQPQAQPAPEPEPFVGPPMPEQAAPVPISALKGEAAVQRFINNPEAVANDIKWYGKNPAQQESIGNLYRQFQAAEAGVGNNGFPPLSDQYRRLYSGEDNLLGLTKSRQDTLELARRFGGMGDPASLDRIENLQNRELAGPPAEGMPQPSERDFGVRGLEALPAFGYRSLDHLAEAAANGDANVPAAIHALGDAGKQDLLEALTRPGYSVAGATGGKANWSAAASNTRAAALLGATQAAALGKPPAPEAYGPEALLGGPESLSSMTPGQKMQLIQDVRNPDQLLKATELLSPEQKQLAAKNLAGFLSREASLHEMDGEVLKTPKWVDQGVQTAAARMAGNNSYQPVDPLKWYNASAAGLSLGHDLGPYKDRMAGTYRTPEDIQAGPSAQYDPRSLIFDRGAQADQDVQGDWADALSSGIRHDRGELTASPGMQELGPLSASLSRLAQYNPALYDKVVADLQERYPNASGVGAINWQQALNKFRSQGGAAGVDSTGKVIDAAGRPGAVVQLPGQRRW